MTKTVFFDIDGTLVNKHNQIPESAKRAIQQLKANGIVPVIATGRSPLLIHDISKELNIQNIIAMNGQLIMYEGDIIFDNPIKKETVDRLVSQAAERENGIILCGSEDIFSNSIVSLAKRSSVWTALKTLGKLIPGKYQLSLFKRAIKRPPNPKEYEGKAIYQVILETSMEEEEQYRADFQDLHFARSNLYTVDIISAGMSKAVGIEKFLEKTGAKKEDTYAFGDSPNDFEMLKYVHTGVAMGNGWDEIKDIADHVTARVDDDGIEKALKHFGLI